MQRIKSLCQPLLGRRFRRNKRRKANLVRVFRILTEFETETKTYFPLQIRTNKPEIISMKTLSLNDGYFQRVARDTPTRLWVNNATPEQAAAALAAGAVGASTNPTYCSKLPADYLNALIDAALEGETDENAVAEKVYREAVVRLQAIFLPLYEATHGQYGHVAIQGDPRTNTDSNAIIEGALQYRKLGENIFVKMPSTPAGAIAMERLTAMGVNTIATLGFSLSQALFMAEAYERGLKRSKTQPGCYVTYIAGILEDYLQAENERLDLRVSDSLIAQAGCIGHRATYRAMKSRGLKAILIGGGARKLHHFTELVGGDQAITIGWNFIEQLLKQDQEVSSHIDAETPDEVVAQLEKHFPDFTKSFRENALAPDQFQEYGPVVFFQKSFLAGVESLLQAIRKRKAVKAQSP